MQGMRRYSNDAVQLDLGPSSSDVTSPVTVTAVTAPGSLSIDDEETSEARIQRLISEHPVIIFSRSCCYMCHVMKQLLATIGVHPTVIELDDHEIPFLPNSNNNNNSNSAVTVAPSVFIGGSCVGGLESLVALHLSGHLVAKLSQVGAL